MISLTLSDMGSVDGNFLPTLDVSFVIASLDTKFKVNDSLSASINTFPIADTNNSFSFSFENSRARLVLELAGILIETLSPPLNGNPLYIDTLSPSSSVMTLPVLAIKTVAVTIGE